MKLSAEPESQIRRLFTQLGQLARAPRGKRHLHTSEEPIVPGVLLLDGTNRYKYMTQWWQESKRWVKAMLAELRATPAKVMQAELEVAPVRGIRMVGMQRRLAEVNHLRPRGISNNPGRKSSISKSRSMYSNLGMLIKAMIDMMMEIRPWRELDII
jgi:hypothetical protein